MNFVFWIGAAIGSVLSFFLFVALISFSDPGAYSVDEDLLRILKDIVGPIAAGLGGAVAGAYATYKVQNAATKRSERLEEARAYNRALNVLSRKLNDMASYKKSMIMPHQESPVRFLQIPAIPRSDSVKDKAYLLLSETLVELDEFDLVEEISSAEELYASVIDSIYERNAIIAKHRDVTESDPKGRLRNLPLSEVARINGVASVVRLYVFTELIIEAMDDCIEGLSNVVNSLNERCATKLKGRGIKITLYKNRESEVFNRTPKPYFNDPDHLVSAIAPQMNERGLTVAGWYPLKSTYRFTKST